MLVKSRQPPKALVAIERRSIDYVPLAERHGRIWHQALFWFSGDFNFFTVAIGFVGPSQGLGFFYTALASVFGVLFGTSFMALHATQGPDLGLPQMIQSRAQFGYRGVAVVLLACLFTFIGFNVVDTILVRQGLYSIFGLNPVLVSCVLSIVAVISATLGYDFLHRFFRFLFWVGVPLYAALTLKIWAGTIPSHATHAIHFSVVAFAAQFAACASYNITFAPYVSDYTRYLPKGKSRLGVLASVYLGAVASPIWLVLLGAWLAVQFGVSDGLVAINLAGNYIFPHGGEALVAISILALAAAMGLNAYSGTLTLLTLWDSLIPINPTLPKRLSTIIVIALIWFAIAGSITANATAALYNALSVMLYLLAPWTAINLCDYFLVRRGRYKIDDLFKSDGIYGRWAFPGLSAYFVGLVATIPFINLPGVYEGAIATNFHGVDVAWLPGLLVSGGLYLAIMRFWPNECEGVIENDSDEPVGLTP